MGAANFNDLDPITPPNPTLEEAPRRSAMKPVARVTLCLLALVLLLSGLLLAGASLVTGGSGTLQLILGVLAVVGAVALTLELRRTRSLVRLILASLLALAAAPFVVLGLILFVIYPAAAALRGM